MKIRINNLFFLPTLTAALLTLLFPRIAPAQTTIFNYTGTETTFTLDPGIYDITAYGAQGGNCNLVGTIGGLGAEVEGQFDFSGTTILTILVGGCGSLSPPYFCVAGGGGGGSFVGVGTTPLVIAGGGGGASSGGGGSGDGSFSGGIGGGGAGGIGGGGGGGGGYTGGGVAAYSYGVAVAGSCSFLSGGAGGVGGVSPGSYFGSNGGYGGGGGGGGDGGGGGGGGWCGGNGGSYMYGPGGNGGSSYVDYSALSQSGTSGVQSGNGEVVIEAVAVPEPSTWGLSATGLGLMLLKFHRRK